MENYKYVFEFDDKEVDPNLIDSALNYAWKVTPSKNNFMNYSVHVIGPDNYKLKKLLYNKCLEQQMFSSGENFDSLDEYEMYCEKQKITPLFKNILSAPYVLIYTQRVETLFNKSQQVNIEKGIVFEQTFPIGTKKYNGANKTARLEVGMFSANLSNQCLQAGLDVSYIGCMPSELEKWQEEEWSFITDIPIIIQLIGYGKIYKKDIFLPQYDLKPDFERIVNFVKNN